MIKSMTINTLQKCLDKLTSNNTVLLLDHHLVIFMLNDNLYSNDLNDVKITTRIITLSEMLTMLVSCTNISYCTNVMLDFLKEQIIKL